LKRENAKRHRSHILDYIMVLRLPFHGAGTVVSTFATATAPSRCAYYPAQHLQQKKRSPIADACAQVVNTD